MTVAVLRVTDRLTMILDEAAVRLGVTSAWLLGQVRARRFPGHKLGRRRLFTESDLQEILDITYVAPIVETRDPAGLTPCRDAT